MRVHLPIIIQVRSRVRAASSPTSHQYHFTLSYPVSIKSYIIYEAHLRQSDLGSICLDQYEAYN